ncbi:unnamed protein product [Rotaria socialis]|uniref:Uncharacterized protein n=1 Tax=Rotaria socialis TaxID=392032 RepID=A0A817U0Y4_9BILA|nr:unnamed protein product [Rotaria socialis]
MNTTALNSSLLSKFKTNTSIGEIFNHMMVEQWNSSIMFESYYKPCQPLECTLSVTTRNDVIYIVTAVFWLLSGLIAILRFIVFHGVHEQLAVLPKIQKAF